MKVSLLFVENCYLAVCTFAFYVLSEATRPMAIFGGISACLLFFPSYRVLMVGAPVVPVRAFIKAYIFGVFCLALLQAILKDGRANEMCILFVASYITTKPLRFLLVVAQFRIRGRHHE